MNDVSKISAGAGIASMAALIEDKKIDFCCSVPTHEAQPSITCPIMIFLPKYYAENTNPQRRFEVVLPSRSTFQPGAPWSHFAQSEGLKFACPEPVSNSISSRYCSLLAILSLLLNTFHVVRVPYSFAKHNTLMNSLIATIVFWRSGKLFISW